MGSIVKTLNEMAEVCDKRKTDLRDQAPTKADADRVCMKSYNQGAAMGYTAAGNMTYRALADLRHKFQNGSLTKADFDEAMGLL